MKLNSAMSITVTQDPTIGIRHVRFKKHETIKKDGNTSISEG